MKLRPFGYSLMELLVVVAVLSIILTLSVGPYRGYMQRTNRSDAATLLLRVAAAQERYYLSENAYAEQADLEALGFDSASSEQGYYQLVLESPAEGPAVGFTARAQAIAGKGQASDTDCAELSINEAGVRDSQPKRPKICWH